MVNRVNVNKFKRTEAIHSIFSIHNETKLKINNRKITKKSPNTGKLNNTLLNSQWVKEEVSKKTFKITLN